MTNSSAADAPVADRAVTILCVDDEPSILSALRRLFRPRGYNILMAESGAAGLAILEQESVDLVISDMRMPEMDGAQFLEQVRKRWPDSMRLLLTGYADIGSIVDAINTGEIFRYITKPWDDNDIVLIVQEALARRALELERRRLAALVKHQNEELRAIQARLEGRVAERTLDLQGANQSLQLANERLKTNFMTSIKVFTALVELRGGKLAGHARRVADLSRRIALRLNLEPKLAQEIFVAGLLHEIGKVGFTDEMLATPMVMMNPRQLELYRSHPTRARHLLMPLQDLMGAVEIIGAQLERFDGAGHPKRLTADDIPIGARILALTSDYDSLQMGVLAPRQLEAHEAQAVIVQSSGKRYDPQVVAALVNLQGGAVPDDPEPQQVSDIAVAASALQVGMVLSRDLMTPSGLLMLSMDHVLDAGIIRKIIDFERSAGLQLTAYVRLNQVPS